MAIAEMKRMSLLVMRRDHDQLLRYLQKLGCVQMTEVALPEGKLPTKDEGKIPQLDAEITRHQWAIGKLLIHETEKKSMFTPLPAVSVTALEAVDGAGSKPVISQLEDIERRTGELRGRESRLRLGIEQLSPWLELDIPLEMSKSTATTQVFTGVMAPEALKSLADEWAGKPVAVKAMARSGDDQYFWALVHRSFSAPFLDSLTEREYQPVDLPEGQGTPAAYRQTLEQALEELAVQQKELQAETKALAVHLPALRLNYEQLKAELDRAVAQDRMVHTASVSMMNGWVPEVAVPAIEEGLRSNFPEAAFTFSDPAEGDEPPVLLHNRPVIAPFESVVTGFALPHPFSTDPTGLMMPFFACFFGMMVSDAGYGLMMALLIPILIKIIKPSKGVRKLMWVLAMGGVFTVFWGAMYNTWFGFAPLPSLLDPMNNSLPVMMVCIGIGALHLVTGLGIGIYLNLRRGKPLDALYDQISWLMLVVGLGLLAVPATSEIGKWLAIAGAVIILLMAGREKTKNPFKRLVSGLGALYNVTGWLSDLLSYMRLFGMGLATGVIGMVINILVGMVMQSGIIGIVLGIVLFAGGHLFNAAINILGAYVHSCRLQYIEFFNKFYEEGGKDFRPLSFSPRYVRIEEAGKA